MTYNRYGRHFCDVHIDIHSNIVFKIGSNRFILPKTGHESGPEQVYKQFLRSNRSESVRPMHTFLIFFL